MKDAEAYIRLLEEAELEDAQLQSEKELLLQAMEQIMQKMGEIDQKRMVIATTIGYVASKIGSRSHANTPDHERMPQEHTHTEKLNLRDGIRMFLEAQPGIYSPSEIVMALHAESQAGTVRTGINALYKGGHLGRVHDKGTSFKYGPLKWLKASSMTFRVYTEDQKVKKKSLKRGQKDAKTSMTR